MALKIRALQKIFGLTGGAGEFGQIGSKAAGAPVTTKNLETMQDLSEYDQGLNAIVSDQGTSVLPYLEDINSLFFLTTSQIAYLMQSGVPEWNDETEYYKGISVVLENGLLWIDTFGTGGTPNLNNLPSTNPSKWKRVSPPLKNRDLKLSRPSTTTVDIDASELTLYNSNNDAALVGTQGVPSSIDLTLDQDNDSAGGGSNGLLGLDKGSFAVSTWYHLYSIANGVTNSCVASLAQNWISTTNDGTAGPTKGVDKTNISGYTFGKYIGAVYVNSGGTFDDFKQDGNTVSFLLKTVLVSGGLTSYQSLDLYAVIPVTAKSIGGFTTLDLVSLTTGTYNIAADTNGSGLKQKALGGVTAGGNFSGTYELSLLEAQTMYWLVSSTTVDLDIFISSYKFQGII